MAECIRTEEALRDSETRYRRLFETAKDRILILLHDTLPRAADEALNAAKRIGRERIVVYSQLKSLPA